MATPNVLRAINRRHSPTQDTLNRLRPFTLRLTLAPLKPSKAPTTGLTGGDRRVY